MYENLQIAYLTSLYCALACVMYYVSKPSCF